MRVRTGLLFIFSILLYSVTVSTVQAQVLQPGPVFTVNITTGGNDGQCTDIHCTVEDAFTAANNFPGVSTVSIPAGTYQVTSDLPDLVQPDISIIGAGINDTIIEANSNNLFRVLSANSINNFLFSDMTIRNPHTIFEVDGSLDLDLRNIGVEGTIQHVYVDNSVSSHSLSFDGLQVDNVTTSSDLPLFMFDRINFSIQNSAFTNSQISQLFDIASLISSPESFIVNTTISGNTFSTDAGDATAITFGGSAETAIEINHVTIADNVNFGFRRQGTAAIAILINASILANNTFQGTNSDCELTTTGSGLTIFLITDTIIPNNNCALSPGSDNPIPGDPLLLPLADNTGDTLTQSFDPASPALDGVACTLTRDQRGISRPQGPLCDIGAFEWTPVTPTPPPPPTSPPPPSTPASPQPQPTILFDPVISKIGFLQQGQTGLVGEQIEWVVTVQNVSSVTGVNVVVSDTLASELRVDSVDAPGGNVSISGQRVTITYGTLAPGQVVQFSIFTTIMDHVDGQITNTACVNADNQGAEECATGSVIATLPQTGETPFWRDWILIISGTLLIIIAGFSAITRRKST